MNNIKAWLVDNGYTDPVEQVLHSEQGYYRAIRDISRKIGEQVTYDETLPLMMHTLNVLKLDLKLEQDKKEEIQLEIRGG